MTRFTVFLFLLLLLWPTFYACKAHFCPFICFTGKIRSPLAGEIRAVDNGEKFVHPSRKMKLRKLMEVSLHDYDYGGPNQRHDPKKGKPPGPGSRNR